MLAQNACNHRAICEEGGIQALIRVVLYEGGQKAQEHATGALDNLAQNSQNQDTICQEGGIHHNIQTCALNVVSFRSKLPLNAMIKTEIIWDRSN